MPSSKLAQETHSSGSQSSTTLTQPLQESNATSIQLFKEPCTSTAPPITFPTINESKTLRQVATVHPTQSAKPSFVPSTNIEVADISKDDSDDEIQVIEELIDITKGTFLEKCQQAVVTEKPNLGETILEIRHEIGYPQKVIQFRSYPNSHYVKKTLFGQNCTISRNCSNPASSIELNEPSKKIENNSVLIVSATQFPIENEIVTKTEEAPALSNVNSANGDKFPHEGPIEKQTETFPAIPNVIKVPNEDDLKRVDDPSITTDLVTEIPVENDNNSHESDETHDNKDLDEFPTLLDDNNIMDLDDPPSPEATSINGEVIPPMDNCDILCHLKQEQMDCINDLNNNDDANKCLIQENVEIAIPVISNVRSITTFSDDEDFYKEKDTLLVEKISLDVPIKKRDILRFHKKNESIFKFKPKETRKMTFMLINLFD